jgi:hypothetical protein
VSRSPGPVVLRDDDPRAPALLDAGWRVAAESWGARLRLADPPDLAPLQALVTRAGRTATITELGGTSAAAIATLEAATHEDFPSTPATPHRARSAEEVAALLQSGTRAFGAVDGDRLLAVTLTRQDGDRAETDVTTVARPARRRGLGAGVKAASVIALAAGGVRVFGTGGAASNAASLAMNRAVGYVVEERWLSLVAPGER